MINPTTHCNRVCLSSGIIQKILLIWNTSTSNSLSLIDSCWTCRRHPLVCGLPLWSLTIWLRNQEEPYQSQGDHAWKHGLLYFTLNGTIIYEMNIMLHGSLETSNAEREHVRKLSNEVINQGYFSITINTNAQPVESPPAGHWKQHMQNIPSNKRSLHTIGLIYATSEVEVKKMQVLGTCASLASLFRATQYIFLIPDSRL